MKIILIEPVSKPRIFHIIQIILIHLVEISLQICLSRIALLEIFYTPSSIFIPNRDSGSLEEFNFVSLCFPLFKILAIVDLFLKISVKFFTHLDQLVIGAFTAQYFIYRLSSLIQSLLKIINRLFINGTHIIIYIACFIYELISSL